jgi:pSer/pThr/pTyr-binding forkhead associated (FHA) protein
VPRWLPQFGRHKRPGRRGGSDPDAHPSAPERTLELLVIEGPDAGSRFTVEGGAIRIGRGVPQQGRADAIGLRDPSVSPHHATILANERECLIVHCAGAASPTLVNGRATSRAPIRAGDRIQIGRTMFEVRSRAGISLSGLLVIPDDMRAGLTTAPARVDIATTEIRGALAPRAELVVLRGIRDREGQRLPLLARANRLGRHPSNEIVLPEQGVSRFHAEILWEGEELIFAHKSQVNPSYVNGERVDERVTLRGGEVIQLADRVALRIEIGEPAGAGAAGNAAEPSAPPSLRDLMEEKVRRDAEIERDFSFTGSFLDLDVVDSHGMKVTASRPEHIIVSFERFRGFASQVVQEHDGQVLNSNGVPRAAGHPQRLLARRPRARCRLQPGARRRRAPAEVGARRRAARLRGDDRAAAAGDALRPGGRGGQGEGPGIPVRSPRAGSARNGDASGGGVKPRRRRVFSGTWEGTLAESLLSAMGHRTRESVHRCAANSPGPLSSTTFPSGSRT